MKVSRGRVVAIGACVALLAAMGFSTTWHPADEPVAGGPQRFDAVGWAEDNYESEVVPTIEENAVELTTLQPLLAEDPEATGEEYGTRDGNSPYTYSVTVTGEAGKAEGGFMPLTVDGIGDPVKITVQVGPAVNGTALRDASGLVSFNDFVNQVEYSDAAIALNNLMKADLLADLDVAGLEGTQVLVVGATAPLNAELIVITPVRIEAAS